MEMPLAIRHTAAGFLAAPVAVVALIGCGGPSGPPAGSIKVTLSEYKFNPAQLQVKAGNVNFYLVNGGSTAHDMVIADSSGRVLTKSNLVQAGNDTVFTVNNLAAGSYHVYCDVPGHKEAGMVATLEVT